MLGYNAKNKEEIDKQYLCSLCSLILRDPVQLKCGHRQCRACVEFKLKDERIKCPDCPEATRQNEVLLDKGFKNDMRTQIIECLLCDQKLKLQDYEDHLQSHHPNPKCEYCEATFNSINSLNQHILNDCREITIPCTLKAYGCSTNVLRINMEEHYRSEQHQISIITFVCHLSKYSNDHQSRGLQMDVETFSHTTTDQLEEVSQTVDILAGGVQTLDDDSQRLHSELLFLKTSLDSVSKELVTLKLSIQEQTTYLDGLKPNQDILQQDVSSLKQKIEERLFVSYDGTLLWKIPNFREKMTDAQSERQTSIYSPPFYSSPNGYKMCLRLYLYGDGNARRTHMSLFFVLMRGEYDAILKFPFSYKVTLCLYDQASAGKHIIDSFRPDIKSNSFQRPRSEMNIASGIPKFLSLSSIEEEGNSYVRDNAMFIKAMVDFNDIPNTMLPFVVGLNPGLPINVQQNMIRHEIERRTQQTSVPLDSQ